MICECSRRFTVGGTWYIRGVQISPSSQGYGKQSILRDGRDDKLSKHVHGKGRISSLVPKERIQNADING
jgi:hypothetical protein